MTLLSSLALTDTDKWKWQSCLEWKVMKLLPELIQPNMSSGGNHSLKELRDNEKLPHMKVVILKEKNWKLLWIMLRSDTNQEYIEHRS